MRICGHIQLIREEWRQSSTCCCVPIVANQIFLHLTVCRRMSWPLSASNGKNRKPLITGCCDHTLNHCQIKADHFKDRSCCTSDGAAGREHVVICADLEIFRRRTDCKCYVSWLEWNCTFFFVCRKDSDDLRKVYFSPKELNISLKHSRGHMKVR